MVDFAAEGLLDGLDDGPAREGRLKLLGALHEQGVSMDDLRRAVAEDRLALLPVELALGGKALYSLGEVAEKAGLPLSALTAQQRALGLPLGDPDEKLHDDEDVEAAELFKRFRDTGLPDEGLLEVSRVIGQGMSRIVDAVRQLTGQALLEAGTNEYEMGLRYAEAAKVLGPALIDEIGFVYRELMRDRIRSDIVGQAQLQSGQLRGATEMAIAFADLVGFTRLGEEVGPEDLGGVAERLAEMASAAADEPVRLVKTIGDAVMLVSTEPEPLLHVALALVAAAEEEGPTFPQLRAGLAYGTALGRYGDWYGAPVNLASRITGRARAGTVVVDEAFKDVVADGVHYSPLPPKRIKGIEGTPRLYRARAQDGGSDGNGDGSDGNGDGID